MMNPSLADFRIAREIPYNEISDAMCDAWQLPFSNMEGHPRIFRLRDHFFLGMDNDEVLISDVLACLLVHETQGEEQYLKFVCKFNLDT